MKHPFNKSKRVRKAVVISPAEKFYDQEPLLRQLMTLVKQLAANVGRFVNVSILLTIILFLSVLIGIYTFPVLQLDPVTLQSVLDTITRAPFPQTHLIISALFASLATFYVYLPKELPDSAGDHSTNRRLTRLIASFIIVVIFDSWFWRVDLLTLSQLEERTLPALAGPLVAQCVAFLVVFIALLFFRDSVSLGKTNTIDFPPLLKSVWNWSRFLLVSIGLIIFTGWFTTWFLLSYLESYTVISLSIAFLSIEEVSLPLLTATAVSVTIAAIIFGPPEHRHIEKRLVTWRLLLIIMSVATALWAYRFFTSVDHFFLITATAFGLTFALAFVQRALS